MMDLKKPAILGLAMLTAATVLSAQSQPIPIRKPQQTPTYRSATDVVSSDVVVRDERGLFIPGLTIKDFEVYEDGVKQKITTFAATAGGRVMTEVVPVDDTVREGLVLPKTNRTIETPGRIFIIFIDDLHLQPLDSPLVKQVLKQIRDTILHENDLVGLVSSGYSSIAFDVNPDPKHLRFNQAIEKVMGASMSYHEIINTAQTMEGPSGLRANAYTAFKTAYEILDQAEKVTNRRKAFIYVSSGYDFNPLADSRYKNLQELYATPGVPRETVDTGGSVKDPVSGLADAATAPKLAFMNPFERGHLQFSESELNVALGELVRRARRANVTFYPVDPRGLIAGTPAGVQLTTDEWYKFVNTSLSSLDVLAAETGGKCICRTNDFKKGLQLVDNDMSDYYMLGYESNNPDPTKVRRRIEIKVLRPGASAIYKDWYAIKR
jgi:VWFA-related protein